MLSMMKEPEDMTLIGPVIEKQQKIINDCVEKKLQLSKLQSTMWEKTQNSEVELTLNDLDDTLINSLIDREIDENKSYKLNK
jgi:hypothetical protein